MTQTEELIERLKRAATILHEHPCEVYRLEQDCIAAATALQQAVKERDEALKRARVVEERNNVLNHNVRTYREASEAVEAELARLTAALAAETELLDAFGANLGFELSWGEVSDEDGAECEWRVHLRSGNRNDREWDLIAHAATPREALAAAIRQRQGERG